MDTKMIPGVAPQQGIMILFWIVGLSMLFSCNGATREVEKPVPVDTLPERSIALVYSHALNTKDSVLLLKYTADTFSIISQTWNSGDGEIYLSDSIQQNKYIKREKNYAISRLLNEITLESDSSFTQIDTSSFYGEVGKGKFSLLDGYAFLRYMGDAEHVMILLFNKNKRVELIYLN